MVSVENISQYGIYPSRSTPNEKLLSILTDMNRDVETGIGSRERMVTKICRSDSYRHQ